MFARLLKREDQTMGNGTRSKSAIEALVKAAEAMPASMLGMETLSPEEMDKLDDNFFALIYKRRDLPPLRVCPVLDAGNTYTSALIWGLSKNALPMAARRVAAYYIKQAAGKFGVTNFPFHDEIIDSANALTMVPMTNVIIDDTAVDNTMTKHAQTFLLNGKYPINDEIDVKTASSYFDQYNPAMDPMDAREYATNLMKCANEYKVDVSDWVKKHAGEYRNQSFSFEIDKRIDLTKEAEHKNAWAQIEKIGETLDNNTLIELVWKMDKTAGLEKFYGAVLPNAVEAVVSSVAPISKEASPAATDGVTDDDLEKVNTEVFKRYYGQSMTDQWCGDKRQTYDALGKDNQDIVKKILQGVLS